MASSTLCIPQFMTQVHGPHPTHVPFLGANCLPSPTTAGRHQTSFLSLRTNNSSLPGSSYASLTICSASTVVPNEGTAAGESGSPCSLKFRFGVGTEQGPRDTMEDVTQVVTDGCCGFFFASVFDGHAGISAARYMEQNLYRVFTEMLAMNSLGLDCQLDATVDEGLCCPLELHDVLTKCYRQADESLLEWLQDQPGDEAYCGCTATTALIRSDRVIVANVGDSRAVLCRKGNAMDLSTEHRVYGKGQSVLTETERVEAVGGWIDDGRVCGILAVSRAFGDPDFKAPNLERMLHNGVEDGYWDENFAKTINFSGDPVTSEPDVLEMSIEQGSDEFLVLATDGLWDVLSSQEAVAMIRNELRAGKHPKDVAKKLTQLAMRKRTVDNTAVVIVDLLGEDAWREAGKKKAGKGLFGMF
ncbi:hypothetical protein Ndes2526B_g06412 [Nannochloris sp. 'desiccata']